MSKSKALSLLLALAAFAGAHAGAPTTPAPSGKLGPAVQPAKEKSIYDKIWDVTKLYHDDANPYIQDLSLVGRFQVEWFAVDTNAGSEDDWVIRRTRIGLKAQVFEEFTIHAEVDLNLQNPHPLYTKLTDAYIAWSPSKEFKLTVGKHGTKFTLDGSTSSTQLITIDRSNIANNFWFPEEYIPGVSISGQLGKWLYNVGYFTSGTASKEFGDFNAGSFGLFSIGYDLAEALGVDKAVLRADYVYQDPDTGNTFTRPNKQVGSVNFVMEKGRCGLGTDVVAAEGYGTQSDLFGVQFMPSYYLNDEKTLQAVFRYTYINSSGDNGIRLARYENRISSGLGDEYHEFYAGLNWYLYGHKLKLQTGVDYADMQDSAHDGGGLHGWGVVVGLRISW